jgi:hypothetical protein
MLVTGHWAVLPGGVEWVFRSLRGRVATLGRWSNVRAARLPVSTVPEAVGPTTPSPLVPLGRPMMVGPRWISTAERREPEPPEGGARLQGVEAGGAQHRSLSKDRPGVAP